MKTVAQWAEQLPELIRIEFLKEAEKQKTDIDAVLDINYSGFSQSLFFHIAEIDKWFWYGLRDNEYVDPTSADYIDESVPYTKSEVDAMILEFADPNDEVCKVMLANVGKARVVAPSANAKPIVLDELDFGEFLVEAPKEKKSSIYSKVIKTLKAENEALKREVEAQKETISTLTQMRVAPKKEQSIFFDLLEHLNIIKK